MKSSLSSHEMKRSRAARPARQLQRRRHLSFAIALAAGVSLFPAAVSTGHAEDGSSLIITNSAQIFPADVAKSSQAARAREQAATAPQGTPPKLDPVQTAALYYYAKERQMDRVEAEIARLQALDPGFVPPHDLYIAADEIVPDETNLWDMFAADDFTGIDAEIISRKAADPSWEPTYDFQSKLARKKQRVRMQELAKSEDWLGLLDAAASIDPAVEPDVDLIWMKIDALSAAGDRTALAETLRSVLTRNGELRLADQDLVVTLQKALRDFPAEEVEHLAANLWPDAAGGAIPTAVRLDIARKQIAEFNADKHAAPLPPETIRVLEQEASNSRRLEDVSLLGWYELKTSRPEKAQSWFAIAMDVAPDPEIAKGMYLSLERQNRDKEAFEFAAANLPELSNDPVFLMNVLSPRFAKASEGPIGEDAVLAYSTAIMETSSAAHAEILGWYAYNSRQFDAAEAWFRQSYNWEASADRLKGLALTFLRLNKKKNYAALKRDFTDVYPHIWPDIKTAAVPKARKASAVKAPAAGVKASYIKHMNAKNYASCLRDIDRLGSGGSKPSVALIRGWCELGLKRFGEARRSFEAAMSGSGQVRADAVYGAGLSLLGAKLTDEAESLISAWPLSAKRDRELRAEIYYQRARSAFDHQQFARVIEALDARAKLVTEPRDLTQLRAWAYYHSGQSKRAKAVFQQLNMVIRDSSAQAGIELINKMEGR